MTNTDARDIKGGCHADSCDKTFDCDDSVSFKSYSCDDDDSCSIDSGCSYQSDNCYRRKRCFNGKNLVWYILLALLLTAIFSMFLKALLAKGDSCSARKCITIFSIAFFILALIVLAVFVSWRDGRFDRKGKKNCDYFRGF